MKVILLQDVARIGRRFEVKDVPDGHGMNYLIPRGLAEPATKENLKKIEKQTEKAMEMKSGEDAAFAKLIEIVQGQVVDMEVSANDKGHLFKGIKEEDVASEISAQHSAIVLATQIILKDTPIKEVGEYPVTLQSGDIVGTFTLNIKSK